MTPTDKVIHFNDDAPPGVPAVTLKQVHYCAHRLAKKNGDLSNIPCGQPATYRVTYKAGLILYKCSEHMTALRLSSGKYIEAEHWIVREGQGADAPQAQPQPSKSNLIETEQLSLLP